MKSIVRTLLLACFASAIFVWGHGVAQACSTPVFQYALENWTPDTYQVTVRAPGELTEGQKAAADLLQRAAKLEGTAANVNVEVVRTEDPEANANPLIEVRFPITLRNPKTIWSGELTLENAQAVLDSPARKKIGELLIDRKSAVWVLLDSGSRGLDEEAAKTLERMLPDMEKNLELSQPTEWEASADDIVTSIDFSMVRLRRDDPAERVFVSMLMASEHDLANFEDAPIVFPIYGRGRVLYALVNKGINEWTLRSAGRFLVGPCSCIVKAENPGVDLLLSVDWDAKVKRLGPDTAGAPGGLGTFLQRKAEAERHFAEDEEKEKE